MSARVKAWWRRTMDSLWQPVREPREPRMARDGREIGLAGEIHKYRTPSRRGG